MGTAKDVIAVGKVVGFHYTLKSSKGAVLDKSDEGDPMLYLHGAENIVPGLERQLAGKQVGDKFQAEVSPEEGYGTRQGGGPQPVPRAAFPDGMEIEVGSQFTAEGPDGELMPVWIAKVEPDTIYVDRNHPLAGETLHFQIEVVSIRDATREETSHGHPHGPGGHHH